MSKRLEDFITANRSAFDDKEPPVKAWDHIEAALAGKNKQSFLFTPLFKWSMAAAAVVLISLSVYLLMEKKPPAPLYAGVTKPADTIVIADVPEVNQFAQMIAVKQQELKMLAKEQPELYQRFSNDINQLDSSYITLKKQLGATPNRELLIEAMIQNLQLQLNVLNQQLNIINQIKQQKNYSHEKIDQAI